MAINGGDSLGLGIKLTAQDGASAAFKSARDSFDKYQGSVTDGAKKIAAAYAGLAAARKVMAAGGGALGGMFGLSQDSATYEKQVARVGLVSQATAADLAAMNAAALASGRSGLSAPLEAAKALESLASQGLNAKESISSLTPALQLAAGGSISAESASSALTSALKVFSLDASAAAITADKLLAISNATALAPRDLELALGTVGRGASLTKQRIEEMLPAMGLVRNTGVDASVAASSVSSALIHMADSAKKFSDIGVAVTDARGEFRPFLDIVLETQGVLEKKYPDAAKRAAAANDLFSKFGLTAYSGITSQLSKGITDASGKLYQGADAVKFLRDSMANAAGTAENFSKTMLDKDPLGRLANVLATLRVEVGQGFNRIFGPIIAKIADGLERITTWFGGLPEPVKKVASAVALGAASFVLLTGTLLTAFAGFKLLTLGAAFLGVTLKGLMLVALPITAAMGLLGIVAGGAFMAIRKNVGGIGDTLADMGRKSKLAFEALASLFSKGGFGKSLWSELSKDENKGVLGFALRVYHVFGKLANFFKGVWGGFSTAIEKSWDAFSKVGSALTRVGEAMGLIDNSDPGKAATSFDRWGSAGEKVGAALSKVATILAGAFSTALEVAAPGIKYFREMVAKAEESLTRIAADLRESMSAMERANGATKDGAQQARLFGAEWFTVGNIAKFAWGVLENLGRFLITVFEGAVAGSIGVVQGLWSAINGIADVFTGVIDVLQGIVSGRWSQIWDGMRRVVYGVVASILGVINGLQLGLARALDRMGKFVGQDFGLARGMQLAIGQQEAWLKGQFGITGATGGAGLENKFSTPEPTAPGMSVGTPAEGAMSLPTPMASVAGMNPADVQALLDALGKQNERPVVVQSVVTVDGDVLAKATAKGERRAAVASFDAGVSWSEEPAY